MALSSHDCDSLHEDYHEYIKDHMNKIELIRDDIVLNAQKSGEQMKERYNRKVNSLCLTIGDFLSDNSCSLSVCVRVLNFGTK
jgi:vacuolar-type H+-ATPase subunit H